MNRIVYSERSEFYSVFILRESHHLLLGSPAFGDRVSGDLLELAGSPEPASSRKRRAMPPPQRRVTNDSSHQSPTQSSGSDQSSSHQSPTHPSRREKSTSSHQSPTHPSSDHDSSHQSPTQWSSFPRATRTAPRCVFAPRARGRGARARARSASRRPPGWTRRGRASRCRRGACRARRGGSVWKKRGGSYARRRCRRPTCREREPRTSREFPNREGAPDLVAGVDSLLVSTPVKRDRERTRIVPINSALVTPPP